MPGMRGQEGAMRSRRIVASWDILDEQSRFEMFSRALLRWCGDDEKEARSLWVELETLRYRSGGFRQSLQHDLQTA